MKTVIFLVTIFKLYTNLYDYYLQIKNELFEKRRESIKAVIGTAFVVCVVVFERNYCPTM